MATINWPVLLKLAGEAELVYLADQSAWEAGADAFATTYTPDDQLIDAAGHVFSLVTDADGSVRPRAVATKLTLTEITDLVRAHESALGSCCVAKLSFGSITQALAAVRYSNQS
jgi:hypothetical protein